MAGDAENPCLVWVSDETQTEYHYYDDPILFIPLSVQLWFGKYKFDKIGNGYQKETARYIQAVFFYEQEISKCQKLFQRK